MMRINKRFSLSVRLLCIVALLSFNFAHNYKPSSYLYHTLSGRVVDAENLKPGELKEFLASELCSSNAGPNSVIKNDSFSHHDQSYHDSVPCHACRIGASILPTPNENQIAKISLRVLGTFKPLMSQPFGTYLIATNTSPRAPPDADVI